MPPPAFPRLLALAGLLAGAQALAQEGTPTATNEPPADSPVRLLALSQALADRGRETGDPLPLLAAARLRKASPAQAIARTPENGAAEADPYAVETLLAEATALAKGSGPAAALAADIRAGATKGRIGSKGYNVATVRGAGTDWYRGQKFEAGRYAEVATTALSGGGADLFVYDDKGNLICRDLRQPQKTYCGWTPSTTASFDIKIENRGGAPLKYQLTTN